MRSLIFAVLVGVAAICNRAGAEPVTPVAEKIFQVIDSLDVEHHWPAGVHVHWKSGVPDGRPESSAGKHTHCSAFVAAAAKRLDIYVLRPPEHKQILLANAQYDWLPTEGAVRGWKRVSDEIEAQHLANQGWLVLAAYRNHRDDKPGHIAIVRPNDKTLSVLHEEGPQITQAGTINYRSIALREGFAGHPGAWERREVVFYGHPVDLGAVTAPQPEADIDAE